MPRTNPAAARQAALQINRHAELLQEINAKDSTDRTAASFRNRAQVDRRQFDVI
jgi:hypothetical protein